MTHFHLIQLSVGAFLLLELVGAAALAFWVAVRFPKLAPQSLRVAGALAIGTTLLMEVVPFGVRFLTRLPHGGYVALLGCVLPATTITFLCAAWLMKVLAGSFGSRAY